MKKDFCLASLVKTLKMTARNSNISDEEFLRSFIEGYVKFANIKDRNGNPLDWNKTYTSLLLNNKVDVPRSLREGLEKYGLEEGLIVEMEYFIENILDNDRKEDTVDNLRMLISTANNLDAKKKELLTHRMPLQLLIAKSLIEAIKTNNAIQSHKINIWKENHNEFNLLSDDIIKIGFSRRTKERCIVAVPVETTFETHVSTSISSELLPLISENTLHGKWIKAWDSGEDSLEKLENSIKSNLKLQGLKASEGHYPIGSIAIVEKGNTTFFLLAISKFDDNNITRSSQEYISSSIVKLLEMYDRNGQGYSLYMPLIGTGRSRTRMTNLEAWELIKQVIVSNKHLIQGNINLVVEPDVYELIVDYIKRGD